MNEARTIGAVYARVSSDMQSKLSTEDQVRICRERASKDGVVIPDENVFVDDGISGTIPERAGIRALRAAAAAKKFEVLYCEDLSRLGRESTSLMVFMKQLAFEGVRIISVNEGIDSSNDLWDFLATMIGLQHEKFVRDLAPKIRRGKGSNFLRGWSVGDHCFVYGMEVIPELEAEAIALRKTPPKRVVIDTALAKWVLCAFRSYGDEGRSISWIAREYTRLGVPKDLRATTPGWHHQYIRYLLSNERYIGLWRRARMRRKRNPIDGTVTSVPAPEDEVLVQRREDLRIVPQDLWDRVQARLRANKDKYGWKKGPVGVTGTSYVEAYPKAEFSGLVCCPLCGRHLHLTGNKGRYLRCGNRMMNRCAFKKLVPRFVLRKRMLETVRREISSSREWVDEMVECVRQAVKLEIAEQPAETTDLRHQLSELNRKLGNLNELAASGHGSLDSTAAKIKEYEEKRRDVRERLSVAESMERRVQKLPSREWILEQLDMLDTWASEDRAELPQLFRAFTGGRIDIVEVVIPGKKRSRLEAHFKGNVVNLLSIRPLQPDDGATDDVCSSVSLRRSPYRSTLLERHFVLDLAHRT